MVTSAKYSMKFATSNTERSFFYIVGRGQLLNSFDTTVSTHGGTISRNYVASEIEGLRTEGLF